MVKAETINDEFQQSMGNTCTSINIANGLHVKFYSAGPKKLARCIEKAETNYSSAPDPTCNEITDMVRCSFICPNSSEMVLFTKKLVEQIELGNVGCVEKVVRFKNGMKDFAKFTGKDDASYRDIKLNTLIRHSKLGIPFVGELQIIHEGVADTKALLSLCIYIYMYIYLICKLLQYVVCSVILIVYICVAGVLTLNWNILIK